MYQERGVLDADNKLPRTGKIPRKVCDLCKTIGNKLDTGYSRLAHEPADGDPNPPEDQCCVSRMLYLQPDFFESHNTSSIQEIIKARGHICLFLPKAHPEFNFIELLWADMKHRLREDGMRGVRSRWLGIIELLSSRFSLTQNL